MSTNFLFSKIYRLKAKVMGSNPGYFLKSFLLYLFKYLEPVIVFVVSIIILMNMNMMKMNHLFLLVVVWMVVSWQKNVERHQE